MCAPLMIMSGWDNRKNEKYGNTHEDLKLKHKEISKLMPPTQPNFNFLLGGGGGGIERERGSEKNQY
jgi:hypothetical protein